jgi:hypothetical protein
MKVNIEYPVGSNVPFFLRRQNGVLKVTNCDLIDLSIFFLLTTDQVDFVLYSFCCNNRSHETLKFLYSPIFFNVSSALLPADAGAFSG